MPSTATDNLSMLHRRAPVFSLNVSMLHLHAEVTFQALLLHAGAPCEGARAAFDWPDVCGPAVTWSGRSLPSCSMEENVQNEKKAAHSAANVAGLIKSTTLFT